MADHLARQTQYLEELRDAFEKQRRGAGVEFAAAIEAKNHLADALEGRGVEPVSIGLSNFADGQFYIAVQVRQDRDLELLPELFEGVKVEGSIGHAAQLY